MGITLISLAYVFTNVPLSEIGEGVRQARWGWLLAVLISFFRAGAALGALGDFAQWHWQLRCR
ncbi:MAG: hypothetical protein R3D55_02210 [Chloroflexota bacterium]